MQTPSMGQSSFYYYNPEPSNDHRQHGHFSPHPSAGHDDAAAYHRAQQHMFQAETVIPASAHMMYPHIAAPAPRLQQKPGLLSPQASPQVPHVLATNDHTSLSLNTACGSPDGSATPTFSANGSGGSSPRSTSGALPTPTSMQAFRINNIEGVKEGCEGEVKNEILAGADFTRSCSPPLTPGESLVPFIHSISTIAQSLFTYFLKTSPIGMLSRRPSSMECSWSNCC